MMFGEVVGTICLAFATIKLKLALAKPISIAFDRLFDVSVAMPLAVLLSVAMGIAGWGCPITRW
jgi:hypothetical protein